MDNQSTIKSEVNYLAQQAAAEINKAREAEKANGANDGYGEALPVGNIGAVLYELISILAPVENRVAATTELGGPALSKVISTLSAFVQATGALGESGQVPSNPSMAQLYQEIGEWTILGTNNPFWPEIQKVGNQLGWSNAQQKAVLKKTGQYGQEIYNKINNALAPLNAVIATINDNGNSAGIGGAKDIEDVLNQTPATFEKSWTTIQGAITSSEYGGTGKSTYVSFETSINSLTAVMTQTSGLMTSIFVGKEKEEVTKMTTLVTAGQSVLSQQAKDLSANGANMPGYGGG